MSLLTCEMAAAARSVNDARPARGSDGESGPSGLLHEPPREEAATDIEELRSVEYRVVLQLNPSIPE